MQFLCQFDNMLLLFWLVEQFISAGVHGVFSWTFCDFGPHFEVVDSTGEEPKECFIWKITKVKYQLCYILELLYHTVEIYCGRILYFVLHSLLFL